MGRVTKELSVVTTTIRAYEVVETFWGDFPYFLEATSSFTFVNAKNGIKNVFAGDVLVWDKDGKIRVMSKGVWDKIYGNYLKEKLKEAKKNEN